MRCYHQAHLLTTIHECEHVHPVLHERAVRRAPVRSYQRALVHLTRAGRILMRLARLDEHFALHHLLHPLLRTIDDEASAEKAKRPWQILLLACELVGDEFSQLGERATRVTGQSDEAHDPVATSSYRHTIHFL